MIVTITPRLRSFCGRFAAELTEKRREAARLRTRGLRRRLAREAHATDAGWVARLARSREGRSHAHELLPTLGMRA